MDAIRGGVEVRGSGEGTPRVELALATQDETLATQDETLATQDETGRASVVAEGQQHRRGPVDERTEGGTHLKAHPERVDLRGPDWQWRVRLHQWRERIRANPASRTTYRTAVAVIGLVVVVAGAIMIPFPGPGWLVVFLGVGIWATEFHWARQLLALGRGLLNRWGAWLARQGWGMKVFIAVVSWLVVVAMFWLLFRLVGVPSWLPDMAQNALHHYARL